MGLEENNTEEEIIIEGNPSDLLSGHNNISRNIGKQALLNETRKTLRERYLVVAIVCITMSGNHFCGDEPAPLYKQFDDWMHNEPGSFSANFSLLFAMYSIPNIFLPVFGGIAVDRYGAPQMLTVFCSLLVLGEFIFALGVQYRSWAVMFLGRSVLGLGGESIYTAKAVIIAEWFPENQIAFAFGVGMSVGRLGTVIGNFSVPYIANRYSLPVAIWVGFFISVLVLLSAVSTWLIYVISEKKIASAIDKSNILDEPLISNADLSNELCDKDIGGNSSLIVGNVSGSITSEANMLVELADENRYRISDIAKFGALFYAITCSAFFTYNSVFPFSFLASGILLERDYFKDPPESCNLLFSDQCTSGSLAPPDGNPSYDESGADCPDDNYAPVLPSSLNISKYNTVWDDSWDKDEYVFDSLDSSDVSCSDDFWAEACTKNYCDAQDDATQKTGIIMSTPYLIGALLCTPLGYLSDVYGHRATVAAISPTFIITAHFYLAYVDTQGPLFPLFLLGIAFAVYCAIIWPCVALTVKVEKQGLAYGVITGIMNLGLTLAPIVASWIYQIDDAYIPNVEVFFAVNGIAGLLSGVTLNYIDAMSNGGKLNKPYKSHGCNHGFTDRDMFDGDGELL